MNIYDSLEEVRPTEERSVALGLFDGVHCGHQAVIRQALSCMEQGLRPAVFTYRIQHILPERKDDFQWISSEEERVREIARIVSGEAVTETAMENAREMLLLAHK